MGCGASKESANMAEQPQAMTEVKEKRDSSKGGIAFEIPVDDIKVAAGQPASQVSGSKKSLDKLDTDPEVLKERLKAKEEQAEKNRQKELEAIQAKGKKRDEQLKAAAERKKKIEEEGGPQQGDEAAEAASAAAANDVGSRVSSGKALSKKSKK